MFVTYPIHKSNLSNTNRREFSCLKKQKFKSCALKHACEICDFDNLITRISAKFIYSINTRGFGLVLSFSWRKSLLLEQLRYISHFVIIYT